MSTCEHFVFSLGQDHLLPEAEEITMISIQLAARFLFTTGFHTKKIVRGPASDWYLIFLTTITVLEVQCLLKDPSCIHMTTEGVSGQSCLPPLPQICGQATHEKGGKYWEENDP